MVESFVQIATLASFGSAAAESFQPEETLNGFSQHPSFSKSSAVNFERLSRNTGGGTIATLPGQWVKRLLKEDVHTFRLVTTGFEYESAHVPPTEKKRGLGILTEGNAGIEIWSPDWTFRGDYPDGRNYKTAYVSRRGQRMMSLAPPDAEKAAIELRNALANLARVFESAGSKTWTSRISALVHMHDQGAQLEGPFAVALPAPQTTRRAKALFADIVRGWQVFTSSDFRSIDVSDDHRASLRDAKRTVWDAMMVAAEATVNGGRTDSRARAA